MNASKTTPAHARLQPGPLPDDGLHEYMAICAGRSYGGYWGRGMTIKEAIQGCREAGEWDGRRGRVVIVPKGAYLDTVLGQWMEWPGGTAHPDRACEKCTFQVNA